MTRPESATIQHWLKTADPAELETIIPTLLRLEKDCKPSPTNEGATMLLGRWKLTLIGGKQSLAQNSPPKPGKILPNWLNIQLQYHKTAPPTDSPHINTGTILNQVRCGGLMLELSGPWKFYAKPQIMAFDFLYLRLAFFGKSVLKVPIRGGATAESKFFNQPLKAQAFFRYFWITPDAIAARGRGGGIALWKKVDS